MEISDIENLDNFHVKNLDFIAKLFNTYYRYFISFRSIIFLQICLAGRRR